MVVKVWKKKGLILMFFEIFWKCIRASFKFCFFKVTFIIDRVMDRESHCVEAVQAQTKVHVNDQLSSAIFKATW